MAVDFVCMVKKQIGTPEIYGNEYGLRGQTFRINAEIGQVPLAPSKSRSEKCGPYLMHLLAR